MCINVHLEFRKNVPYFPMCPPPKKKILCGEAVYLISYYKIKTLLYLVTFIFMHSLMCTITQFNLVHWHHPILYILPICLLLSQSIVLSVSLYVCFCLSLFYFIYLCSFSLSVFLPDSMSACLSISVIDPSSFSFYSSVSLRVVFSLSLSH